MKLSRLKEARELQGWSQKKLAEESGVSRDSISNYETGQREAWPATARRLADALGVEIADLSDAYPRAKDTRPKAASPSPTQLLERAGINTRWLVVPEDEFLEATRGRDKDEDKNKLISIAHESLLEWFVLVPGFMTGYNPVLNQSTLGDEYVEAWTQAAERRIKIRRGLEELLDEAEEYGEQEKEARMLEMAFRGLSDAELEQLKKAATEELARRSHV